jgi:hypothetical protein
VLRINFSAPNTGSKGNNRFDNITVEGEPINDSINDISKSDYILYPNPVLNILNLKTTYAGEKMISIYNSAGILMSSYFINGTQSAINTSFLSQGMYFIKITETSSKKSKSLKFIKEQ